MNGIRARVLARGVVIEYGHTLAKVFHPILTKAIPSIFGKAGISEINSRRQGEPLGEDITSWGIDKVTNTIYQNWRGEFEAYFRREFPKINRNEFRDDLRRLRHLRDNAAHPEIAHRFNVEDAKEFLRAAERTASKFAPSDAEHYRAQVGSLDDLTTRNQAVLERYYPDEYETDFATASQLWITGTNLRRIASDPAYLDYIKGVLAAGGIVKILMHHPNYEVCKYAMMQDGPGTDLTGHKKIVHDNLSAFCKIRAKSQGGKNLLIRTIDYMLAFGLDIMNGSDETRGVAYIRFYPLPKRHENLEDRPIVKLNQNDARWYRFFVEQFERHWNDEVHQGWAEDVPADYPWTE